MIETHPPHASPEQPAHEASLRRIERTHALLGAVLIAGALLAGPVAVESVAAGWLVMALSMWMWKLIARRALFGGPGNAGVASAGMMGKMLVTFGGVVAIFQYLGAEALPFVVGTLALPVACVAAALRTHPAPLAHTA